MPPTARGHSRTLALARRALAFLLGVITACVVTSCALLQPRADPTKFYVLTSPNVLSPSATADGPARYRIGLRAIEMPAYLRTKRMAVRSGANEIHFAEFDRWAEPLDGGISRVLKEALRVDDNVELVAMDSQGDDPLDYSVTIRVQACEGVRGGSGTGSIIFGMTWEIQPVGISKPGIRRGSFTAASAVWDGKNYGQLARQLSLAITAAGQALAADLRVTALISRKSNVEASRP